MLAANAASAYVRCRLCFCACAIVGVALDVAAAVAGVVVLLPPFAPLVFPGTAVGLFSSLILSLSYK